MSTAHRYIPHYTIADYQQWEGDWELWQGIPVAMTPSPFFPHQACVAKLVSSLLAAVEAAKCSATVAPDVDWIISEDTVVRPDILLVCGDGPEEHVTEAPALIVEIISPSTANRDRNEKRTLYQDQGVDYYLIVDPNDKTIEAYHRDDRGQFQQLAPANIYEFQLCGDCLVRWEVESIR